MFSINVKATLLHYGKKNGDTKIQSKAEVHFKQAFCTQSLY